jgi:excisionase family DNA binding protein
MWARLVADWWWPRCRGQLTDLAELDLITPEQLSALFQVRKSWIYDQVEAGHLPCVRLGRQPRFHRCDIALHLERLSGTDASRDTEPQ